MFLSLLKCFENKRRCTPKVIPPAPLRADGPISNNCPHISDGSEPISLTKLRLGPGSPFFEKILGSIQARAWLFEKGPENWSFLFDECRKKVEAHQGSGSTFLEGPKLGPNSSSTFKAWAHLFRARPITAVYHICLMMMKHYMVWSWCAHVKSCSKYSLWYM